MAVPESQIKLPPELPARWLDQIKNAVKEGRGKVILMTILGSSVISALVSIGGDYLLETRKAKLEVAKKEHAEKVDAYANLGKQVEEFHSDLDSAVMTFEYAVNKGFAVKGSKADFNKNVDNSIKTVAVKIIELRKASMNARIDDASIKENTKQVLAELPQYLAECQRDKSALPKVINLFKNSLGAALENLKGEIEKKKNSISLESS